MEENKYALWLIPSDESYVFLTETIRCYSQAMTTPMFEPHITLISRLRGSVTEVEEKARELADAIDILHLILGRPAHSDSYFKCVFLHVEPDFSLLQAHVTACNLFVTDVQNGYSPHLSLVYGSLTTKDRERIIAEIGDGLSRSIAVSKMCLYQASSDSRPDTWKKINSYCLCQPQNGE